jgi:hypothetical protein
MTGEWSPWPTGSRSRSSGSPATAHLEQLEDLASATHTPVGYLFLPAPPEEALPVADFRTVGDEPVRPSPDLLDTLDLCQQRQD